MRALQAEGINKVSLIAFTQNDIGNAFWNRIGWTKREDLNYYDFTLNEENIYSIYRIKMPGRIRDQNGGWEHEDSRRRSDKGKRI